MCDRKRSDLMTILGAQLCPPPRAGISWIAFAGKSLPPCPVTSFQGFVREMSSAAFIIWQSAWLHMWSGMYKTNTKITCCVALELVFWQWVKYLKKSFSKCLWCFHWLSLAKWFSADIPPAPGISCFYLQIQSHTELLPKYKTLSFLSKLKSDLCSQVFLVSSWSLLLWICVYLWNFVQWEEMQTCHPS